MILLDPTAKPAYSVYSTNHSAVKVRVYSVQPMDWQQFQNYARRINYDDDKQKPAVPGKLVSGKTVQIKNTPDELVETRIDLTEFLEGGFGHLLLDIEPTVKRDKYDRTRIFTWAQATQIGLDAFVDNQELVGFATELKTGKPLAALNWHLSERKAIQVSSSATVKCKNAKCGDGDELGTSDDGDKRNADG
jgi:hypothetical protein